MYFINFLNFYSNTIFYLIFFKNEQMWNASAAVFMKKYIYLRICPETTTKAKGSQIYALFGNLYNVFFFF